MSIYENNALTLTQSKKSEPRIPFGWLIERKLIEPGTILYDQKENTLQKLEQMVLLLVKKLWINSSNWRRSSVCKRV